MEKCGAILCTNDAAYIVKIKGSKYYGRKRCKACAHEALKYPYAKIELIPIGKGDN
jgi:hypothetical protein